MADAQTWQQRVEEWRASGESAAKFSAARGFAAETLYRWARRLGRDASAPTVRLARVVRSPATNAEPAIASSNPALVIEIGGARLTVGHGADVATVVSVLAIVAGGSR